jgi:hypothetical protein
MCGSERIHRGFYSIDSAARGDFLGASSEEKSSELLQRLVRRDGCRRKYSRQIKGSALFEFR